MDNFNFSVIAALVLLTRSAVFSDLRPNYITDEEFAAVANQSISVTNSTVSNISRNKPIQQPRPGFGSRLWTNAQVPYILDTNFNDTERLQVALAIKQYHDNTCIRFTPKQDSDSAYVSILLDSNVCGLAQLCMKDGGQFAKFGGTCVTAGVMTHELGHTLCMSHEQSRQDRDTWISFNTSVCTAPSIDSSDFSKGLNKLYDYVSIEHYEDQCYGAEKCYLPKQEGITKCGSGGALSVLDIEILNEVYGCNSDCLGYRFVNSKNGLNNSVITGEEANSARDPLLTCRAYHQGDIIPGKYHPARAECYLPWGGNENVKTGDFIEILTNPNNASLAWAVSDSLPSNAIRGGRSNERETLYIIRCQLTVDGVNYWTPGKYQGSTGAYTSYGGDEIKCGTFQYLVCG